MSKHFSKNHQQPPQNFKLAPFLISVGLTLNKSLLPSSYFKKSCFILKSLVIKKTSHQKKTFTKC